MSWFSSLAEKAMKAVDNLTDTLVEQANAAQEQIAQEQKKIKEEAAKQAKLHGDAALPWETDDEQLGILSQDVMEKVLALSLTEQNFTEPPPKLNILPFVFSDRVSTAMRLLALDSNLARMHSKLSPKMDEEVFWQHYFFRVEYIRLKVGLEKIGPSDVQLIKIKDIPEDDIIYKPTFVPPPKPPSASSSGKAKSSKPSSSGASKAPATAAGASRGSKKDESVVKQMDMSLDSGPDPLDDLDVDDDDEDDAADNGVSKKEIEERRKAEAALAAEVEAELDNDDIDLGDLEDLDLDNIGDDDFDDLGDLDISGTDSPAKGAGGAGGDDDDEIDDIEAEIERELKAKNK